MAEEFISLKIYKPDYQPSLMHIIFLKALALIVEIIKHNNIDENATSLHTHKVIFEPATMCYANQTNTCCINGNDNDKTISRISIDQTAETTY